MSDIESDTVMLPIMSPVWSHESWMHGLGSSKKKENIRNSLTKPKVLGNVIHLRRY